jgi:hypothetical protein
MSIKNNDDVAHLLESAGRADAPYREFQTTPDSTSAPLIDAVFAQAPPLQESQQTPGLASPPNDLLSEVFDRPAPPPQPTMPAAQKSPAEAHPSGLVEPPTHTSYRRSLADIRRIIARTPSDEAEGPPSDSLHGLFDRLAG